MTTTGSTPPIDGSSAAWLERQTGQRIARSTALLGGMSSVVERHDLDDGDAIVTRHITDREWLAREPHLIPSEANALRLLASSAVRVPALVAADPKAGRLAMTHQPGAMVTSADELQICSSAMAALAAELHAVELPVDHDFIPWRPWTRPHLEPPAWGEEALWVDAIAVFETTPQPTASRPALLHRDLHPLNILWDADQPTLVDWVNACVGHPHAELGHCRWNLTVLVDLDTADAFLAEYLAITNSGPYHRYWDLAPVMSFLPGPPNGQGWRAVGRTDLTLDVVVHRTETFLRDALATMDGYGW